MGPDERERFREQLWKSQEDEVVEITADEVRAKAHRYERHSVRVYWVVIAITPLFIAAFVYNIVKFHELWLILGQVWALTAFCFIAWRLVRHGPNRMRPAEPCAQYLRRELAGKREGLLWLRRAVLLFFPAMVASSLGGGPLLRAKSLGITSPFLLRLYSGYAPLIGLAVMLAFIWFAFTRELRKVERDIENLGRE